MKTVLLKGNPIKEEKFEEFRTAVENLKSKNIVPQLTVIQVGNNESSNIYIGHKEKASKKIGVNFSLIKLDENISIDKLKYVINKLNHNPKVNGILVQLPLPKHLSKYNVEKLIDQNKDVDGVHPYNQGSNFTNQNEDNPKPCTAIGIMEIFKRYNIKLEGRHALIIGRSNIVGRPVSSLLNNANATTTIVHSRTSKEDLDLLTKNADIIILATGLPDIISPNMVKKGVIIIDVGISRLKNGKIRGDILHKDFVGIASYITPVPGGVGPMTITMLMKNIIQVTQKQHNL